MHTATKMVENWQIEKNREESTRIDENRQEATRSDKKHGASEEGANPKVLDLKK